MDTVLEGIAPLWFNKNGCGMYLLKQAQDPLKATVTNGRCHVILSRDKLNWIDVRIKMFGKVKRGFRSELEYRMSLEELKTAFGIDMIETPPRSPYASMFNADLGVPGAFIRKGRYLNMPNPGNGQEGDPNASIYVSDSLKAAVARFLVETSLILKR